MRWYDKHWMTWTRIYGIFRDLKTRCNNKKCKDYHIYWGRWIINEWGSFNEFYKDMKEWYEEHLTIDRINNDWNYYKSNCKWSTRKEQQMNKKNNLLYKWIHIKEYCKKNWVNYYTIISRIYYKSYTIEQAIETPIRKYKKQTLLQRILKWIKSL